MLSTKKMYRIPLFLMLISGAIFVRNLPVYAAIYYMPGDFSNLKEAFAGMSGGDTLNIKDGVYTGPSNVISTWSYPPLGSKGAYTVIKAEHPGNVVIDGEGINEPFHFEPGASTNAYWQIEGIIFKNSSAQNAYIVRTFYVKFIGCGFEDAASSSDSFATHTCSYILVENCYSWGNARYHFHYYGTDHSIIRRCVVRHDRGSFTYQVGFQIYNSEYILLQNCIFLDSDQDNYYNLPNQYYAFKVPQVSKGNITLEGCIALHSSAGFLFVQAGENNLIKNCIAWDLPKGDYFRGANISINHCTYGRFVGTGSAGDGNERNFYNNLLCHVGGYGIDRWGGNINNDYNALYEVTNEYHNVTPGVHSFSKYNSNEIDPLDGDPGWGAPALKYLCRIENGSNLEGAGSDGGNIGATVLYEIGAEGTLWGDAGYDEVTSKALWPFPNDDIIREKMRNYSYDNGNLRGDRGFCADGETLTKYIWEYLGNPIPAEIYDGGSNNQPPTANAGPDQSVTDYDGNGMESITLDGSSSSDPDGSIVNYAWSENGNQIASTVSPAVTLNAGVHVITLMVTDDSGATGTDQVNITVNPQPGDNIPPTISDVQASNITATDAIITWNTDEVSTGRVVYGLTESYGLQAEDSALTLNHQIALSGLNPNTAYYFKVYSKDSSNNESSSAGYTFTTQGQSGVTFQTLQDFEDGSLWVPGGSQDPSGNGRGWAFLDAGANARIDIANIGANGSNHSLKITFDSDNPQIYFRSNDKTTDHMPEAAGANRMSFYVRFPEGFPIQSQPFRYDTWQFGTFIHDPNDWNDTHRATYESDHGIHHYYHRVTIEQVGNGWVKYIFNTHPDQANYSGSTVPPDRGAEYFNNFGRFYFHFGPQAGGPDPGRPFTIYIDEIKFYYDDGSVGGQVHTGGQNDAGFDGQFFPDSTNVSPSAPGNLHIAQ